ncbi:protein kinase C and casein kinase substrate in neurons protein 1-like [Paramacrobiotus metropolitanus]|uniref:protein kinase C and casein kinase substrate in neurons protein 1-like n=1 Tax=Paramacrobiotus metropolitanus TaxID=2943436 RepID=UPI0024465414|nr:protein kinase C and casein kinase substrate in neurons protein 1-like [Paramacrobiotus metropolitanus]
MTSVAVPVDHITHFNNHQINHISPNNNGKMVIMDQDVEVAAESDCFWEPGNYKRTTKRISDAYVLCNELIQLIQERGEIEAKYATTLRSWSKKWNAAIDKGNEYGTMAAAWKATLNEADRLALTHIRMKEKMDNEVVSSVRQWQKDNFHKTIIRDFKEKKELDDAFRKAQKPWEKKLRDVQKTKSEYHAWCQKERTAIVREKNSAKDTSISPDQKKKLEDDVVKFTEQKQQMRDRYEKSLRDINEYNAKYMEDMGDVYDKCSEQERQRLTFFKQQLKNLHRCVDISRDENVREIYQEFWATVDGTDPEKDLRWWSKTYGIDMPMNWPIFEEFQPEVKNIAGKKSGSKALAGGDGIALTGVQYKFTEDDVIPPSLPVSPTHAAAGTTQVSPVTGSATLPTQPLPSPFPEEDWDDDLNSTGSRDVGDPGIPVRAMYDYKALEDDELSFKKGDVFEKLEDEDDQGWCKGRKDGRLGLFPASYVKDVPGQ